MTTRPSLGGTGGVVGGKRASADEDDDEQGADLGGGEVRDGRSEAAEILVVGLLGVKKLTDRNTELLRLEATLANIQHHLKVAGLKESTPLFSDDALKRIAEWAQGIPRRINQICTAALIAGAVAKAKVIDATPVRQAINDLEHE